MNHANHCARIYKRKHLLSATVITMYRMACVHVRVFMCLAGILRHGIETFNTETVEIENSHTRTVLSHSDESNRVKYVLISHGYCCERVCVRFYLFSNTS